MVRERTESKEVVVEPNQQLTQQAVRLFSLARISSPLNRTKRGWEQSTCCHERTRDCESPPAPICIPLPDEKRVPIRPNRFHVSRLLTT